MKISVEFDTISKVLVVTLDDKKVKNISEVLFLDFGDSGGAVEMRQSEFIDDEKVHKVTKIMADERGKYQILDYDDEDKIRAISERLLRRKVD